MTNGRDGLLLRISDRMLLHRALSSLQDWSIGLSQHIGMSRTKSLINRLSRSSSAFTHIALGPVYTDQLLHLISRCDYKLTFHSRKGI